MTLRFQHMGKTGLETALGWARAEGWNPGLDDAEAFLAADSEGFFMAHLDGGPVAAISVVNHNSGFAFLGLYLCLAEYRGRGIGFGLWRHALEHAGNRTVGLDGVPAQQHNYSRSGFEFAGITLRLQGTVPAQQDDEVRLAGAGDAHVISELDRAANGYERQEFISVWVQLRPERRTLLLAPKARAVGYATIRRCYSGAKIGPVVAPDAESAMRLARAAVAATGIGEVMIDVPATNGPLHQKLEALGLARSFPTARMYRGNPPAGNGHLQAVGTLELG